MISSPATWFTLLKYIGLWKSSFENKFFWYQEIFYKNFDFKYGCKNEFKDNNEKSCSLSKKKVSHKIDFKAQRLRNGHADSVGVKPSFPFQYRDFQYTFSLHIFSFKILTTTESVKNDWTYFFGWKLSRRNCWFCMKNEMSMLAILINKN